MPNFNEGIFNQQPGFDEAALREAFGKALTLRTLVVQCVDPRATGTPSAVAKEFGDVYPGELIRDENGKKVGWTATLMPISVAGGRAMDALRTIMTLNHLLGLKNLVVVHHTFCGTTAFTPEGIASATQRERNVDISGLFARESMNISNFEKSLQYDVKLLRESPVTPKHVNIYGYIYDIDTEQLTKVVEDLADAASGSGADTPPTSQPEQVATA